MKNKLEEECLKVEELQRQLESNKLKNSIFDIVQKNISNLNVWKKSSPCIIFILNSIINFKILISEER